MPKANGALLDRVVSIALAVAAVSVAGTAVYRELVPRPVGQPTPRASNEGRYHPDWKDLLGLVRYVGDSVSPVQMVEFIDLECPACRAFHEQTLPALRQQFDPEFSLGLLHFPLGTHRFAGGAAKAAECAAEQGRFVEFVDVALAKQDSFGLKPWESFARDARVPDLAGFTECNGRPGIPPLVDSGMAAAKRFGVYATPTVLVNGWSVGNPSPGELARVIGEVAANRVPYQTAGGHKR